VYGADSGHRRCNYIAEASAAAASPPRGKITCQMAGARSVATVSQLASESWQWSFKLAGLHVHRTRFSVKVEPAPILFVLHLQSRLLWRDTTSRGASDLAWKQKGIHDSHRVRPLGIDSFRSFLCACFTISWLPRIDAPFPVTRLVRHQRACLSRVDVFSILPRLFTRPSGHSFGLFPFCGCATCGWCIASLPFKCQSGLPSTSRSSVSPPEQTSDWTLWGFFPKSLRVRIMTCFGFGVQPRAFVPCGKLAPRSAGRKWKFNLKHFGQYKLPARGVCTVGIPDAHF